MTSEKYDASMLSFFPNYRCGSAVWPYVLIIRGMHAYRKMARLYLCHLQWSSGQGSKTRFVTEPNRAG